MVEVYYYIPSNEAYNAVECGLKLSKWYDREVNIKGDDIRCLSALLNPKDDYEKYRSDEFKCLKMELPSHYCFAADKYLYEMGLKHAEIAELYVKTIMPVEDYRFGAFRLPECLVTTTVLADQISILDKRLDSPVLFDNSEELYINNIIENYKESNDDFNDSLLYYFYNKLADDKKVEKIEDFDSKIAVYINKEKGKAYIVKIPDMDKF